QLDELDTATVDGMHQGRSTPPVCLIDARPGLQKAFGNRSMTAGGRPHERGLHLDVAAIDIGARIKQILDDGRMTSSRGTAERRPPVPVGLVDVGAGGYELTDAPNVAA